MRPLLRRFLTGGAVIIAMVVLAIGWIVLSYSSCDYRLIYDRPSPTDRYVAELFAADCGMGSQFAVLMLRDRSAVALPRVDRPAGAEIAWRVDELDPDGDVFWEGEDTLVIQYGDAAPELERAEWGGVRIEARRAEP